MPEPLEEMVMEPVAWLLVKWGEGTPLRVTLFLRAVSKYEDGAEACNCNLTGERNNDYHLGKQPIRRIANASYRSLPRCECLFQDYSKFAPN